MVSGVLIAVAALAYGFLPPAQNVTNQGWNHWQPDAGYAWKDARHQREGVAWQPGQGHPVQGHVVAAISEQQWMPEAGYSWRGTTLEEGVVWQSGAQHPAYAHAFAADTEGSWATEPGYVFSQPDLAASETLWKPGTLHPTYRNVIAATAEGTWVPRPGYTWEVRGQLSNVLWTPGLRHSDLPNLIALEQAEQRGPLPATAGSRTRRATCGSCRLRPARARKHRTRPPNGSSKDC